MTGLTIPLLGDHQAHNASLAVMTAEILRDAGYRKIDDTAIAQGLRTIHWPLRFEVFDQTPVIVLDAAHNPDSMRAVAGVLTSGEWSNRRRVLVFAASADKDARSMIEIICPHFDDVVFTRFLGKSSQSSAGRTAGNCRVTGRMEQLRTTATLPGILQTLLSMPGTSRVTTASWLSLVQSSWHRKFGLC